MFGKIVEWMKGRKGTPMGMPAARLGKGKPAPAMTIPMVKGFELEGLGLLGGEKAKSASVEKESFRD